jgi:hypothetical protein
MATKQMNISFQVQNGLGTTNSVTIALGGTTVYTGTLASTGPIITGGDSYSLTNVVFDIDVPVATANNLTSTLAFSAEVNGGTVQIQQIQTNYNYFQTDTPVYTPTAGTVDSFTVVDIVSQPTWNGEPLLDRYNIEYNNGPIAVTGPGQVLIYSGETAEFNVNVSNFNNALPLPT